MKEKSKLSAIDKEFIALINSLSREQKAELYQILVKFYPMGHAIMKDGANNE